MLVVLEKTTLSIVMSYVICITSCLLEYDYTEDDGEAQEQIYYLDSVVNICASLSFFVAAGVLLYKKRNMRTVCYILFYGITLVGSFSLRTTYFKVKESGHNLYYTTLVFTTILTILSQLAVVVYGGHHKYKIREYDDFSS